MRTRKINRILTILKLFALSNDRGVGLRLSQVSEWSGIPRSTTYRYLKKLEKISMVLSRVDKYRNEECNYWYITTDGIKYVEQSF